MRRPSTYILQIQIVIRAADLYECESSRETFGMLGHIFCSMKSF